MGLLDGVLKEAEGLSSVAGDFSKGIRSVSDSLGRTFGTVAAGVTAAPRAFGASSGLAPKKVLPTDAPGTVLADASGPFAVLLIAGVALALFMRGK